MKSFDFLSLDYFYYPVSAVMWFWHRVFGSFLGQGNAWAWALSIVFLVFTLRAIMFKPFLKQMDSQLKMQAIQPEMKRLRAKYKDDRQRLSQEMMQLQKDNGVSMFGTCLPALAQAPVFIGLLHVLRSFKPGIHSNYVFGASDVNSFIDAKLFGGAPLSAYIHMPTADLTALGGNATTVLWVVVPLAVLAAIATHLTSRRSTARQREMGIEVTSQTRMMSRLTMYLFPLGVLAYALLFRAPIGVLVYWLSNNTWTFGQLWVAHRMQDRRQAAENKVIEAAKEETRFSTPPPGVRPTRPRPGAKPVDPRRVVQPTPVQRAAVDGPDPDAGTPRTSPVAANESAAQRNGSATTKNPAAGNGSPPPRKPATANGAPTTAKPAGTTGKPTPASNRRRKKRR